MAHTTAQLQSAVAAQSQAPPPGLREDALKLDQSSNAERLKALTALLRERELKFEAHPFPNPRQDRDAREQGRNLAVTLGSGARTIIVGAHFDAARLPDGQMSHAMVDNAAGVSILIHVARALRQQKLKHRVQFVFFDTDPIGKGIKLGDGAPLQIVGVVGHVKQWGLDGDDKQSLQAQLYEPFRQRGWSSEVGVVVRAEGFAGKTETALLNPIRQVAQSQHGQNVVYGARTMNEVIAETLARRRFSMILLNAFAVVALLLASVGLYGVISYLVGQHTHELGIRLALGAQRRDVLRLVLSQGLKMALGGVTLGLLTALGLTRLLTGLLYGVGATDPATFAVITSLLTAVALLACFVPAWRATKVDPLVALRSE